MELPLMGGTQDAAPLSDIAPQLVSIAKLEMVSETPVSAPEGGVDRSPGCSAAKPWVNPLDMGSALEGRRKSGGIPAPARVVGPKFRGAIRIVTIFCCPH